MAHDANRSIALRGGEADEGHVRVKASTAVDSNEWLVLRKGEG